MEKTKFQMNDDNKARVFQKIKLGILAVGILAVIAISIMNGWYILLSIYGIFFLANAMVCIVDDQEDFSIWHILCNTRWDLYEDLKNVYVDVPRDILQKKLSILNAEMDSGKYFGVIYTIASATVSILYKLETSEYVVFKLWLGTEECLIMGLGICLLGCVYGILQVEVGIYNSIKKDVITQKLQKELKRRCPFDRSIMSKVYGVCECRR